MVNSQKNKMIKQLYFGLLDKASSLARFKKNHYILLLKLGKTFLVRVEKVANVAKINLKQ